MNIRFDGELGAVSGAGHGIRRAIAESFARLGAEVHGCDLYPAEVPGVAMSAVDLTDRTAAAAWIEGVECGGRPVSVLVSNGGGVAGQAGRSRRSRTRNGTASSPSARAPGCKRR